MPTITLSWSDLALFGLTVGLVGSIVLIGRSTSVSFPQGTSSNGKKTPAAKKKKTRSKKGAVITAPPPTSSPNDHSNNSIPSSASSPPTNPPKDIFKTPPNQPKSPEANQPKSPEATQPTSPEVIQLVKNPVDPNSQAQADFPPLSTQNKDQSKKNDPKRQRPFAERHIPPVRKTVVDDMIDEDVEKPLKLARVMNIVPKPQDTLLSPVSEPEDGWEKVPNSKPKRSRNTENSITIGSTSSHQTPSTTSQLSQNKPSKRQRQNAKKKEAIKALKAVDEAERLRQLASHKRDQERIKMNVQSLMSTNNKATGKKVSGGMKSSIGEDGRLIWE